MSMSVGVLELKRHALELKNAGDLEGAKTALRRAKKLEATNEQDPTVWKEFAAELQHENYKEAAKEAMEKARLLEREQEEKTRIPEDPVNKAIDEANLEELLPEGAAAAAATRFSEEDMLDVGTLADMRDAGMEIPKEHEYTEKARHYKGRAIAAKKQNNMESAKIFLRRSKLFEAAVEQLFRNTGDVLDMGAEEDGEDYSLLEELMGDGGDGPNIKDDDGFLGQLFGEANTNAIDLDDLDDLDPSMLRDMMDAGMEIPDVDEVLQKAKEKKAMAIACKKGGNLIAAKAALEESKRLEAKANQLSAMLRAMTEQGGADAANIDEDPEAALEAMMAAAEGKPTNAKPQTAAAPTAPLQQQQEPEKLKSSLEYKSEALRCKSENRIPEAAAALRLYKKALVAEANAAEAKRRREHMRQLEVEVGTAEQQIIMFRFYQRFVDETLGSKQLGIWQKYQRQCVATMEELKTKSVTLERTPEAESEMMQIDEADLGFIGKVCDPDDVRIEVSVLELVGLAQNKALAKILPNAKTEPPSLSSIKIVAVVQLPPNEAALEENIHLIFKPESNTAGGNYGFSSSQFVDTERGTSRFAKTLVRRLNRKRILLEVYYAPVKKGFFRSTPLEETLLGTTVLELKTLLTSNCITGEFPLTDKSRRREVGGSLRVGIRTGRPFEDADGIGLASTNVDMTPYDPFVFSANETKT